MIPELTTYGVICDTCERELPRVHASEEAARSFAESEGWVSRGFEIFCLECIVEEMESSNMEVNDGSSDPEADRENYYHDRNRTY